MTIDDVTVQGQQLHHQTEMLTRRLAIARTALETIGKGEWAPDTLKTACEALNTLDTLDGLDAVNVLYRKTSDGNQQLQYEHGIAERKMAIARTALETIANGETDPEVRELARETLDGFNDLSDGEKVMGFFIGVQQDQPIPEVDPTELKRFHENVIERSREAGKGAAISLGVLGLGQGVSGEDAGPLCVRNWVIGIALMQGLLIDWQQGTELEGSVYRVAANIPVNGIKFDPEAFVTRLRAERCA
jgi:hypothetical protein